MAKDTPRASKRNKGDVPYASTTSTSKRAKRRAQEQQEAAAYATRKHEANRVAKMNTEKSAKQKKEEDQRQALYDLAEKRKKCDGSLDKDTANTDAINEEDVAEEAANLPTNLSSLSYLKIHPRRLPVTSTQSCILPAVRANAHQQPHAHLLLVRMRWAKMKMPPTRRHYQHRTDFRVCVRSDLL